MIWVIGVLLVCTIPVYSQTLEIQGSIQSNGTPVSKATVTVRKLQKIIAYTNSDENGSFLIKNIQNTDSLIIEVRHLGYTAIQKAYIKGEILAFELKPSAVQLKEIEVKTTPRITKKNDTLVYNVATFSHSQDQNIGDVLNRMPGFTVKTSGEIEFNGQKISSLYLDGSNLLEDNYRIGTKTISPNLVKNVEVLQHHNHKKVLQKNTLNQDVALNLVFTDDAKLKLNGKAKVGLGIKNLYNSELNALLLKKKVKMLQLINANNVGNDPSDLYIGNPYFNGNNLVNQLPTAIIGVGNINFPPIQPRLFRFNQSGFLNSNNVFQLSDSLELRITVNKLIEQNHNQYFGTSENYFGKDTIKFIENQRMQNKMNHWAISAEIESNKSKSYFSNKLLYFNNITHSNNLLNNSETQINQHISQSNQNLSNTLEYIPLLKNQNILMFKWQMNMFQKPETFQSNPGLLKDILNNGEAYRSTIQQINIPTIFNHVSASYQFNKGIIKHSYQLEVLNEFQKLQSQLSTS